MNAEQKKLIEQNGKLLDSLHRLAFWIEDRHPELLVGYSMVDPYSWEIVPRGEYVEVRNTPLKTDETPEIPSQ